MMPMTAPKKRDRTPFNYESCKELGELQETKAKDFVRQVIGRRKEGISADREGFLYGRYGASHMIPNPNKE
jgi:hypothetical protein